MEAGPAFHAAMTRALKREGFAGGHVWVGCREGRLDLIGESGGQIRIAPKEVARLRIGYEETKYRKLHQMLIWRQGVAQPLNLAPLGEHGAHYAATVRAFAADLAAEGKLAAIERGTSRFSAVLGPVLMAIPAFGALAISIFVLEEEPWWGRMIVPAVPLAIFALLLWLCFARHMPRPIQSLMELDKQLP
ncbi:MAG TPA: hypothetical protein VHA10_02260 [Hypericibacter adhaerens]|jgi:hypothetical protein|uniref:Uncharacterized protein n=1 Tax=Hypericibacter adhaerens TaxID=2602016 RepID=A0A5J6N537_9PROT|nr:hypothetical protein [Hypericibacter adhaerens]QEX25182.1 hypothetical protein FRZ61_51290 [Hypericibacter adhaerens]HWA42003.1 hypothetical protein [Hypericibacter adhaerens]